MQTDWEKRFPGKAIQTHSKELEWRFGQPFERCF